MCGIEDPRNRENEKLFQELRLLNEKDLKKLFPDAEILHERVLGLSKSLIALKKN